MTREIDVVARARALVPLVRAHADAAEASRRLPAEVAQAFARDGLYRIGAPERCGGVSADPRTQIEVIETIATADGSAGWNLMIGIETFGLIAPGFGACIDLIADPLVVMCSSTAAIGRADSCDAGYRVHGRWQFVSGCHNSSLFGATVRLYRDGEPIPHTGNVYAILERADFEIVDTWHVGGLCGSGSHDVVVDGAWVAPERIVAPIGGWVDESPLLRFPLAARLAYNKVAVSLGIARAALDAFVQLAEGKVPRFTSQTLRSRPAAQRAVAAAEVRVRGARSLLLELVDDVWSRVLDGEPVPGRLRAIFQAACSDAVAGCAHAVDAIADAAGTTANMKGHPLERAARDIRVVRQHATVASHHLDDAGRVLLGLPGEGLMLKGVL
jgi:alkylation response protein AidB-like acyl-CoA dehydrogenase